MGAPLAIGLRAATLMASLSVAPLRVAMVPRAEMAGRSRAWGRRNARDGRHASVVRAMELRAGMGLPGVPRRVAPGHPREQDVLPPAAIGGLLVPWMTTRVLGMMTR